MTTVLDEIRLKLDQLDQQEVERSALHLSEMEKDETSIYRVSDHAQRLWALMRSYEGASKLAQHAYQFDALNEAERAIFLHAAQKTRIMFDVIRELVWAEMRLGAPAWLNGVVALRKDWILVATPDEDEDEDEKSFKVMKLPLSAMPPELKAFLAAAAARGGEPEEVPSPSPKKRKPQ